uniref:Non-specific serine/threonine protein kinase n=1 Tax=Eptatretus burgeri TaxID=7764 RepID=A0A8C4N973_EPTBU
MTLPFAQVTGLDGNYRITCHNVVEVLREHRDSVMAVLEAFVYDPLLNWRLMDTTTKGAKHSRSRTDSYSASQGGPGKQDPFTTLTACQGGLDSFLGWYFIPQSLSFQHKLCPVISVSKSSSDPALDEGNYLYELPYPNPCACAEMLEPMEVAVSHKKPGSAKLDTDVSFLGDGFVQHEALNKKAISIINRVRDKLTGRDFSHEETLDVPTQVDLLIKQATSHENLCQCYIGWCPFW